jgi:hypothetical protein
MLNSTVSPSHAQTSPVDRGSVLIGGDASFTSVGIDNGASDGRVSQLSVNPNGQYLIRPGLAVGGDVLFTYVSDDGSNTTRYGVGPAVTYFFGRGERSYYPFVSGSFGVTHARDDNLDEDRTQTSYRGAGGLLVMLSRSVGVSGELFYQHIDNAQLQTNTFGIAFGISAFVF